MSHIEAALLFATRAHSGQPRKGNKLPYIVHPISVASYVRTYTSKYKYESKSSLDELMSAAYLHDVVEDCNVSYETLEMKFNKNIANLVKELTSDKAKLNQVGKTDYLKSKLLYMSDDALLIKLCDRLDNIIDSVNMDNSRIYLASTLAITRHILSNRKNMSNMHTRILADILGYCYEILFPNSDNKASDVLDISIDKNKKLDIIMEDTESKTTSDELDINNKE
jgi:(p)ppGpp synthase/HD superfamily hydrolase